MFYRVPSAESSCRGFRLLTTALLLLTLAAPLPFAPARAQAAVFELGAGRVYTVIKMDERRDVESRSVEDMMDSVRDRNAR